MRHHDEDVSYSSRGWWGGGGVSSHIGPGLFKFCVNVGVTSLTLALH